MKAFAIVPLLLAAAFAEAQPAAPTGPAPTGIVVGTGNFFSPIVADLDKAIEFYRDGIGFETPGPPGDANANAALRDMFGLPDAKIRWMIGRAPGIAGGVEMVEIVLPGNDLVVAPSAESKELADRLTAAGHHVQVADTAEDAAAKPLARRMQDSGAFTLLVLVRDIDSVAARLKKLGTPVLTVGGAPALVPMGPGTQARMLMVRDPDGHFVEIVQPPEMPATAAPATANIVEVRVRLTVDDVPRAIDLYQNALGLELVSRSEFVDNAAVAAAFGMPGAQFRFGMLRVPTSGLTFEVIDFKGVERSAVRGNIQDPGSTRIQMRVRDVDEAIAAFAKVGGQVVSTGGVPLELPAGPNKLKVAIVREPDNLFVVLIESPPPAQ